MPVDPTGTVRTGVTGPFPRTEELVQATRDFDRGRIGPDDAAAAFARADAEVAALEERLGMDIPTGGYLRWADLFRPFTEIWKGVEAGPLTRFFETNTFYRQPIFHERPVGGTGQLRRWLPNPRTARVIVPGPYTFSKMSDLRYSTDSGNSPVEEIARALAEELRSLGHFPLLQVQFQEPMLVYDPPRGKTPEVVRAYRHLADALPRTTKLVWTYFGDAGPVLPLLAELPVDVVGLDLFDSALGPGATLNGRALGLGCLDSRSSLPEEVGEVARLARSAVAAVGASSVWLGPSPPLDLLPFDAAVSKLTVLPRLKEALAR